MFGLGVPELIIIMVIALVIFGVGKLPQVGEGVGKAIRGFRRAMSESEDPDIKSSKEDPSKSPGEDKS